VPKEGELTYFSQLGESGRQHSIGKPFSDGKCHEMFADLSLLFEKLPRPPAKVLECGCGTGWLSYFLAKRGYRVTAQDVSEEAVELARENPHWRGYGEVEFVCSDFEHLDLENEYDAVVFYGSLHHAQDELGAISSAYRALRQGGIFLSFEPGKGHEKRSRHVIEQYDVGDRDMPPTLQIRRGKEVGFREFEVYMHPGQANRLLYGSEDDLPYSRWIWKIPGTRLAALALLKIWLKRKNGVVLMRK
jgi:SAM-dependent methyltransferase